MKYEVIPERLEKVLKLSLKTGSHSPDSTFCVMEAVAYVAGEPWSDKPRCTGRVLTQVMIWWNDKLPSDEERTRLLSPFIARLVGTRSTEQVEDRRVILYGDHVVRVVWPMMLRAAKQDKAADELASLPAFGKLEKLQEGLDLLDRLDLLARLDLLDLLDRPVYDQYNEAQSALVERLIACTE